jgi:hypothetical protein
MWHSKPVMISLHVAVGNVTPYISEFCFCRSDLPQCLLTHRLLTLGSQVDARLEISRTQIAAPRIEPGSVLDPQQYKPAEPARGMKLGSPVASAASAPAVELSSIGASTEATAFSTTFIFPRNSKELLRARVRSEWIKFAFYSYVWPPLFWLLRFSFAASLVLSILLILVAIIIVIVIACSDRERHDMPSIDGFFGGSGGGGGGPHVIHHHHGPSFWDWYWTMRLMDMANPPVYYYPVAPNGHVIAVDAFGNPIAVPQEQAAAAGGARQMAASSSSEWDPVIKPDGSGNPSGQPAAPSAAAPPRRNRPDPDDDDDGEGVPLVNNRQQAGARETRPMNFVAAVFSWLFGDGAPNSTFEAQQWEAMAEYIRGCGGVVMAAELRPFQIKPLLTPGESDSLDEEAFMLPIMSHFDGNASPSACGTFIVYHFPSLTSHAHIRDAAELERADPLQRYAARNKPRPFVLESFWQFSLADSSSLRSVMWLGAFNLILLLLFPFICTAAGVTGQHDLHPTRAPLPPGVTLPPKRGFTIHQDPKTHVFTASFDKVPPVVTATKVSTTQAPGQAPVPPVQAAPTMLFDASTSTVNEPTKAVRRRLYRNRYYSCCFTYQILKLKFFQIFECFEQIRSANASRRLAEKQSRTRWQSGHLDSQHCTGLLLVLVGVRGDVLCCAVCPQTTV